MRQLLPWRKRITYSSRRITSTTWNSSMCCQVLHFDEQECTTRLFNRDIERSLVPPTHGVMLRWIGCQFYDIPGGEPVGIGTIWDGSGSACVSCVGSFYYWQMIHFWLGRRKRIWRRWCGVCGVISMAQKLGFGRRTFKGFYSGGINSSSIDY